MIPFWVIFLSKRIFSVGEMPVPYARIGSSIVALIIPLCIGYSIQRFLPRVSRVMIRVLKPLSSCLIIFIIVFATFTNLYLFKIFSWKVSIFLKGYHNHIYYLLLSNRQYSILHYTNLICFVLIKFKSLY